MTTCLSPFGALVLLAVSAVVEGGGSYGQFCSDKHACENGGTCDPTGNSDSGRCTCPTNYTGDRCQKECSTGADCMNGATCRREACICAPGYTGGKCACNTNADCKNKGTCEARGCKCTAGYTGGKCESVLSGADHVITFPATVLMCVVVQLTMKA
ncbi:delta-like protein C [Haliotis rubra]|uniref:delta-like protein C n=1 Tax=Haliotis rubra TaxID=36100 RepID=UPI001EE61794|nr:delta-like protein C [Haliotis rubra]